MIVNFLRFQIDVGERSCGGVSTGENLIDDGLGEGAGMVSFITEIRPKVVNQYFIWFVHLLKYVPKNFSDLTSLE